MGRRRGARLVKLLDLLANGVCGVSLQMIGWRCRATVQDTWTVSFVNAMFYATKIFRFAYL